MDLQIKDILTTMEAQKAAAMAAAMDDEEDPSSRVGGGLGGVSPPMGTKMAAK